MLIINHMNKNIPKTKKICAETLPQCVELKLGLFYIPETTFYAEWPVIRNSI